MNKICTQCRHSLPFTSFLKRKASRNGHTAACGACLSRDKQTKYWIDPTERQAASVRASTTKSARFERDPAYKRAFYLWGTTKKRHTKKRHTKIPPWVKIVDFVPVCQEAIAAGPDYEIDHVIPLRGKLVSGLHVPSNLRVVHKSVNHAKHNHFPVI